jgi:predicted dehydrogenase
VIVSTTNDALAPVASAAIESGKHVLVEKPAARTSLELQTISKAAAVYKRLVRVGFNHRYHPALQQARRLVDAGAVGELMFLRGRYGHGGRSGYDREWRADPARSGGGELIDQGVHLIDLSRWFLGPLQAADGAAHTYFWDMPVDDNAFMRLTTAAGQTAFLHASCTEWKNLFSFELTCYRMRPEMGPPDTTVWEYPGPDESWTSEFADFLDDIALGREPDPGLSAAAAALEIVETIYTRSGYPRVAVTTRHQPQ